MLPAKIQHWLAQNQLPPRLLLSGGGNLHEAALNIASQLTNLELNHVTQGIEPDVKLVPDNGERLKIGDRTNPDTHTVRGLINWLNQTPVASHRVLILENLERTSRDAMQAWLKILEEPPKRAQFILTTQNHHRLPTTILSRVTVLPCSSTQPNKELSSDIDTFLSTNDLITKFRYIDELDKSSKENPQAVSHFMTDLIQHARQTPRYLPLVPLIFTAYQDLERNVNRRLVLEHLALQLQNH